ncbi:MAG: phosphate transport system regulatory protein PhoU [Acidimicrobiia bacterium]|nr:MAG: phosphate transport system regulatory protein PhoU [Acidimicrobiia bacterium]
MPDVRSHFHQELERLEQAVLDVSDRCDRMIGMAVEAVCAGDLELAERVVAEDNEIDRIYLDSHDRWIELMARQQPMGSDLRLMSVILHLNVTLERSGDQCVNIAKMAQVTEGLPRSERIVSQIREMGDLVRPMLRTAVHAFIRRDAEEARLLPAMDEPVDRINRNMYREVVACGPDPKLLEWATRMMMVSRALERIGDQAVDIGEQVVFLVTGEYHEFSEEAFLGRGGGD